MQISMNVVLPDKEMQRKNIIVKGARVHNLKNISVEIPRNKLVVITGVSGSGKSSLAYNTLYAEGQRRYVESLSAYARQFIGKMNKPDVDFIHGIPPSVAIEQKVISRSSRSTVGTSTEIYDYLKILFARIGKTFSPISGNEVKKHTVADVVNYIESLKQGTEVTLLAPVEVKKNIFEQLESLQKQGFSRIELNRKIKKIDSFLESELKIMNFEVNSLFLVIDRFITEIHDKETQSRISDSVQTAFYEGHGKCTLQISPPGNKVHFFNKFELDGIHFEEPNIHLFSFNSPMGACRTCEGFGSVIGLDEKLIVPNPSLSVFDGAIACWKGDKMGEWKEMLVRNAHRFGFPVHRPYNELSESERKLLWTGNKYFKGLHDFFKFLEQESYKIQYRVMLARYRGKTTCPECQGSRLCKNASYVKVAGKTIGEIVSMQVKDLLRFFKDIRDAKQNGTSALSLNDLIIAERPLTEIITRLQFLFDVGLGYLTLNRPSNTLSGGESQRLNLATSLGSPLVGSLYILDEPSIGLHPHDTQRLINILKSLRDTGNTVIVVEHDEEIIRAADYIIDMGPGAGTNGGNIVFKGNLTSGEGKRTLTLDYLTGKEKISVPVRRRKIKNYIEVVGARENNLKNLNIKFPLNTLTVVAGVSGSGKTSLVKKTLYEGLIRAIGGYAENNSIRGDLHKISRVEIVDQEPIGKNSRSNPVTYIKAYDDIRNLFASQTMSRLRGYKPSTFSFNVEGGRCEVCEGEGEVTIEMQFMADIHLECESCKGKRFKDEVLEVEFNGKNISDVLNMTVDEAVEYFSNNTSEGSFSQLALEKIKFLKDVGMGYVKLGQSSRTLSGGEAQRIKLATFLSDSFIKREKNKTVIPIMGSFFIFDEPTTGLHFHDIKKLLHSLNRLVDEGNTIVVIEHNMDVIKCADWIIELGPEGGDEGGYLMFAGTPEDMVKSEKSITGKFLMNKL